jgi:hypothetical protein
MTYKIFINKYIQKDNNYLNDINNNIIFKNNIIFVLYMYYIYPSTEYILVIERRKEPPNSGDVCQTELFTGLYHLHHYLNDYLNNYLNDINNNIIFKNNIIFLNIIFYIF